MKQSRDMQSGSIPAVASRQAGPAVPGCIARGPALGALLILISLAVGTLPAAAATGAAKNREGNALFEQGKFEDAARAYEQALGEAPGRAEIPYNLGNAYIKQKKYEEALSQLRAAVAQGEQGLQASGWYNAGNALYEMGRYGEAAQSYIQALRINPADREAKHNLELALRKQQQQQQQQQQGPSQDSENENQEQSQDSKEADQDPKAGDQAQPQPQEGQQDSPDPEQGDKPVSPQASEAPMDPKGFSKERALQILDALQNQELAERRRLLERQARKRATGRDW